MRVTSNENGFTLAEAMLATVILATAAAAMLLPFTSGAQVRAEGYHRTIAAKLASDLMEEIVATDFDQIVSAFGTYAESKGNIISDFGTGAKFTDPMYANFTRDANCLEVYVEQEDPTPPANFILATVSVYYNEKPMAIINRLISE